MGIRTIAGACMNLMRTERSRPSCAGVQRRMRSWREGAVDCLQGRCCQSKSPRRELRDRRAGTNPALETRASEPPSYKHLFLPIFVRAASHLEHCRSPTTNASGFIPPANSSSREESHLSIHSPRPSRTRHCPTIAAFAILPRDLGVELTSRPRIIGRR